MKVKTSLVELQETRLECITIEEEWSLARLS